jgi:MFS family permease
VEILFLVTLNSLGHLAFIGSRMTSALYAHHLGASPAQIGVVMALFAALPMLLSVSAGRLIDRRGPRRPLLAAYAALVCGGALPFLFPRLEALYLSSTLLGVGFMFVHIGMNSVIGAQGRPEQRAINFAWLALSFSISGSLGPLVAGFAIDGLGHAAAFLALCAFPLLALVLLALRRQPLPRPPPHPAGARHRLLDLLRVAKLRRVFLVSGMMAMGWDLFSFLIPLYGLSLGLGAVTIGLVMAIFAVATFVVRLALPVLIRRVRQWMILTFSLGVAGVSYLLFPLAGSAAPLMAISFLLGLGLGSSQPVIMAILYEAAPPGRQGEAVGIRTTMINASQTFIPLGSGALALALGMAPVFWLLSAGLLGAAWMARRQAVLQARGPHTL